MNTYLRSGRVIGEAGGRTYLSEAKIKSLVGQLKAAVRAGKLLEDVVLYRGIYSSKPMAAGATIMDAGFWSTSLSPQRAAKFAGGNGESSVLLKLVVPKGTDAAMFDAAGTLIGEGEIMLQAGTQVRVLSVARQARMRVVTAEVIP